MDESKSGLLEKFYKFKKEFEMLRSRNESWIGIFRGQDTPGNIDAVFNLLLPLKVEGREEEARLFNAIQTVNQLTPARFLKMRHE